MKTINLSEHDVCLDSQSGHYFRVLRVLGDKVVVFNMDAPLVSCKTAIAREQSPRTESSSGESSAVVAKLAPAWPEIWTAVEALSNLKPITKSSLLIKLIGRSIAEEKVSDAEKSFRSRATKIIESIAPMEPELMDAEGMARLVNEAASRFNCSRNTVLKYLRSYWFAGNVVKNIKSRLNNCGRRGEARTAGDKKLGRPRSPNFREQCGVGVNVSPEDKLNISKAVKYFRKNKEKTLEDAYLWMLGTYYRSVTKVEGKWTSMLDEGKVMTFSQFEYHARSFLTETDKKRRKAAKARGSRKPRRRFSGKLAFQPEVGESGEVDALRTNVSNVSELDRAATIGGAIIFLVVEYSTGLVMGLAIGWDGEDYGTFVEALISCTYDKKAWCAEFGYEIEAERWPVSYLTQRLCGDRGSAFVCHLSDQVAKAMAPNPFINAPPGTPEAKGTVEETVKQFKMQFARRIKGAWIGKLGSHPPNTISPHKQAALTRRELTKVCLEIAVDINSRPKKRAPMPPDLIARGVPNSALRIVQHALDTHRHRFRRILTKDLQKQLLPRRSGAVGEKGIYVGDDLYYIPKHAKNLDSEWYRRLEAKNASVEVLRDERIVDDILLCHPEQGGLLVLCTLTERCKMYAGMSLREVRACRAKGSELNRIEAYLELPGAVCRSMNIDNDVAQAIAATKAAHGGLPPSKRNTSGKKQNRANEKKYERDLIRKREERLADVPADTTNIDAIDESESYGYPDLDELCRSHFDENADSEER